MNQAAVRCGFCRQSDGCGGDTRCFHFENSREGFLRFSGQQQEITGVRALTSLRMVMEGECVYRIDGSDHRVSAGESILLNAGDEFDLHLSNRSTQLVTICFDEPREADIACTEVLEDEQLIDTPQVAAEARRIHFPRRVFRPDDATSRMIQLLDPSDTPGVERLDGIFSALYQQMLRTHSDGIRSIAALRASRASVRVEIERRLSLARDHMHSNLQSPLDLEHIASIASMSKHHFIRSFKQAYKTTPYQMMIDQRLRAALAEIEKGESTITAIAQRYRFSSVHHFSKAFKRRYHAAPSTFLPKPLHISTNR